MTRTEACWSRPTGHLGEREREICGCYCYRSESNSSRATGQTNKLKTVFIYYLLFIPHPSPSTSLYLLLYVTHTHTHAHIAYSDRLTRCPPPAQRRRTCVCGRWPNRAESQSQKKSRESQAVRTAGILWAGWSPRHMSASASR